MKYLFLAVVFSALSSVSSFASEVSFKCEFSDLTYVSQFALDASNIAVEDGKFEDVEFDFSLRKAGNSSKVERYVVTRSGNALPFNAGINPRFKAMRLSSAVKGAEVEYINLLVGTVPALSSSVRFSNGMTYFGNCNWK